MELDTAYTREIGGDGGSGRMCNGKLRWRLSHVLSMCVGVCMSSSKDMFSVCV